MQPERLSMLLVCSITASRSLNPRAFYLVTASMSPGTSSRLRSMERLVLPCTHRSFFWHWQVCFKLLVYPGKAVRVTEMADPLRTTWQVFLIMDQNFVIDRMYMMLRNYCSPCSLNIALHGFRPQGRWEAVRRRPVSSRRPRCRFLPFDWYFL